MISPQMTSISNDNKFIGFLLLQHISESAKELEMVTHKSSFTGTIYSPLSLTILNEARYLPSLDVSLGVN